MIENNTLSYVQRPGSIERVIRKMIASRSKTKSHVDNKCDSRLCLTWYLRLLQSSETLVELESIEKEFKKHDFFLSNFSRVLVREPFQENKDKKVTVHLLSIGKEGLEWIGLFQDDAFLWLKVSPLL